MQSLNMQKLFAYAALFLLPMPALSFGVSLQLADAFLIFAVLLNFGELTRIHTFQFPFLLAVPFFLVSALYDREGSLISVLQTLYIWGFLLPFGWTAFTQIPLVRIAQVLLLASAISCLVAIGQGVGWIPDIGKQHIVHYENGINRVGGLSLGCTSLTMSLTPCFLLLPYIRNASWRAIAFVIISIGMMFSVSKSILLAAPGVVVYLWQEQHRKQFLIVMGLGLIVVGLVVDYNYGLEPLLNDISHTAEHRIDRVDSSFNNRLDLIYAALDFSQDCYLFGYGVIGSQARIAYYHESTVHMYLLGLVVIGGFPAACAIAWGSLQMMMQLWSLGEKNMAVYLLANMLANLVTTVMLVTFQSIPFMIAGAILIQAQRRIHQRKPVLARHEQIDALWQQHLAITR